MKFAAIDVGSNAVRLLFTRVLDDEDVPVFKKEALFRMPLRLGDDVFARQTVSREKADSLLETMMAFQHLIRAYKPLDYMACATSAMREAQNGESLVHRIQEHTEIQLEIIDGKREAEIIYANHIAETLDPQKAYLYIDVGGGSTEIALLHERQIIGSQSFRLGTVRMLKGHDTTPDWQALRYWLQENTGVFKSTNGIGSGGNINKIFNLVRRKTGKPITYAQIKELWKHLCSYSLDERIKQLHLRPDRADVILPALKIFLTVMKWANIKKLYVPQIGLSDGVIHVLYERYKQKVSR